MSSRFHFSLALRDVGDGRIEVAWKGMEATELMGRPLTAELRAQVGPALAMMSLVPNLYVTKRGAFIEAGGFDGMIEQAVSTGLLTAQAAERLRTPESKAALSSSVGGYWQNWVGAWTSLHMGRGEVHEGEGDSQLGNHKLPARSRIAYLADTPGGDAHLLLTTTMQGPGALAALAGAIGDISKAPLAEDSGVTDLRYSSRMEVLTDPATLRPRHAHYEMTVELHENGAPMSQRETRDDDFDWDGAQGCR